MSYTVIDTGKAINARNLKTNLPLDLEKPFPHQFDRQMADIFAKECFIKLPSFFYPEVFHNLQEEGLHLLDVHGSRKDFVMKETENTPRHITTVSGNIVGQVGSIISALSNNQALRDFLSKIADEPIYLPSDRIDRHTVHQLHKIGDVHGGHVDTYAFVLVICLESPGVSGGGEIQFVPHSTQIAKLNTEEAICKQLNVGDCYFMRSNKAVHRLLPLKQEVNRTVIVMTYADEETKGIMSSYSSNILYD